MPTAKFPRGPARTQLMVLAAPCLVAALASGCAGVPPHDLAAEADRLRDMAMKTFEAGDVPGALSCAVPARAIIIGP